MILPFAFLFIYSHFAKIASATLFYDVLVSSIRLAIAYFVAAALAWLSAVLFSHGRRSIIALPIFDVLQSFPTFAALPLGVMLWGETNFTVIFFLVITIIWPIFFSVLSSTRLAKHDWQEAVFIARLQGWDYLRLYLWPVTISGLITGSIIGLGEGWEALVATEMIVGMKNGLGPFFQMYSQNSSITAFGILGLLILIFGINKIIWIPLLDWSHQKMEE